MSDSNQLSDPEKQLLQGVLKFLAKLAEDNVYVPDFGLEPEQYESLIDSIQRKLSATQIATACRESMPFEEIAPEEREIYDRPPFPGWETLMLYERQRWFLMDTIRFFNLKNRGVADKEAHAISGCVYYDPCGCGCAIGRWIPDKQLCQKLDELGETISNVFLFFPDIIAALPKWLVQLGGGFLGQVQKLHDNGANWTDEGLSPAGANEAAKILFSLEAV